MKKKFFFENSKTQKNINIKIYPASGWTRTHFQSLNFRRQNLIFFVEKIKILTYLFIFFSYFYSMSI